MSTDHMSGKEFTASPEQLRAILATSKEVWTQISKLNVDNGRGKILFFGAQLEEALGRILLAFLIEDKISEEITKGATSPFGSFSSRVKAAFALGLISKAESSALEKFGRIRNRFAHQIDASCQEPKIADLIRSIPSEHDGANEQEMLFNKVGNLWVKLAYRPILIAAKGRRVTLSEDETGNFV